MSDPFLPPGAVLTTDTPEPPATDTPPAEPVSPQTPANDTPPATPPAEPSTPADEPKNEPDYTGWLKENLGYESPDAIKSELAKVAELQKMIENPPQYEWKSQEAKELEEYISKGGKDPYAYMEARRLNVDELSDMDALLQWNILSNPGISRDDHQFMLSDKYNTEVNLDPELATEEELAEANRRARLNKIMLQRDAVEAKENLANLKSERMTPKPDVEAQKQRDAQEKWARTVDSLSDKFKGLEFKGEEGEPFFYSLDEQQKQAVIQQAKDIGNFWASPAFKGEDGNIDPSKILEVIAYAQNMGAKSQLANHLYSEAVTRLKNQAQNKNTGTPDTPPPAGNPGDPYGYVSQLNKM